MICLVTHCHVALGMSVVRSRHHISIGTLVGTSYKTQARPPCSAPDGIFGSRRETISHRATLLFLFVVNLLPFLVGSRSTASRYSLR